MAGRKRTSVKYLNNENILREIRLSKEKLEKYPHLTAAEALTSELVKMIRLLVNGVAQKHNWRNYSYIEDMKAEALKNLCQVALKFNEKKSQNPFSYYTQCVWSCFLSELDREKKVAKIRDSMLEDQEMMPSFRRQAENEEQQREPSQKEIVFKKTIEDETQENAMKKQLQECDDLGKLLRTAGEINWTEMADRIGAIFEKTSFLEFMADIDYAKKLLPQGTTWKIDRNLPVEYGVKAMIVVTAKNGTKISKPLPVHPIHSSVESRMVADKVYSVADVTSYQDWIAAEQLVLIALSLHKDTLVKSNKTLIERSLKWSSGKPSETTSYKTEEPVQNVEPIKKKRGRKPKAV